MDEKQLQALANELAKNLKTPEDLSQFDRLLKKISVEAALNAEMSHHLGYDKNQPKPGANSRNGYSTKTVITGDGPLEPRTLNRPGFPGECFICELRLPDHRFRWKHNKLFLLLPEEYGPAFPAIVDCYTSPPTLVWPVPLLHGFSSSYGVLPPLCKDH
ncbi:integrase [Escherichia coli]|nr:integrase [Escherichia coli]